MLNNHDNIDEIEHHVVQMSEDDFVWDWEICKNQEFLLEFREKYNQFWRNRGIDPETQKFNFN
tara:strand:- start:316 stop:504 length:189 start_codon:yes stop_codon:yes gene_type:complete